MASSGTCCIDHQPIRAATAVTTNTRSRFRAESSMMLLIISVVVVRVSCCLRLLVTRGLHPALGVDEESAGRDDAVAGGQARDDLHALAVTPSGLDEPWLELARSTLDEDRLAGSCVENGVHWNGDRRRMGD